MDSKFDIVICWFTSFGYFGDAIDRDILHRTYRSLRDGGRLLVELSNAPYLLRHMMPSSVTRVGKDLMLDERRYDPISGRLLTTRTVLRGGHRRTIEFSNRIIGFPELRNWLYEAGFDRVEAFGESGRRLVAEASRLIAVATRR